MSQAPSKCLSVRILRIKCRALVQSFPWDIHSYERSFPCGFNSTRTFIPLEHLFTGTSIAHSRIRPYFFSHLLTCEAYLIEVSEIMAQMWYYIYFLSLKPIKVSSVFVFNYLKKVVGCATTQKNLKTNTKTLISSIWIHPQRPQGCQKIRIFFHK